MRSGLARPGEVRFGVMWQGAVGHGMARCGKIWYDTVWLGRVGRGRVRRLTIRGAKVPSLLLIEIKKLWSGKVWLDTVRCGKMRSGEVW